MFTILKNLIVVILLLATLGLAYYFFYHNSSREVVSGTDTSTAPLDAAQSQLQIRQLQELRELEIDDDLFVDQRFRSLIDFSRPVAPAAAGRGTPFLRADSPFGLPLGN